MVLETAGGKSANVNRGANSYTNALLFSRRAGLTRRVGPGGCGGKYNTSYFAHIPETMFKFLAMTQNSCEYVNQI